ncbi:MAG: GGDEF domain-containing protein [Betaproteobacteria bacterium]|nr:GGDEF domain-containing protein [Betaproteobacteria bacterium]
MALPLPWDRKAVLLLWRKIDSRAIYLFNRINYLPLRLAYLIATLMLAAIAAADYFSHIELMLSPFYALPCLLVDWRIGRTAAIAYGLAASAFQTAIGTFGGHPYSHDYYLYADIVLNVIFYGVLIWLVAKLRVALEMERVLSRVDFLTKLANRRTFLESLGVEYRRCQRYRHNLTLVLIDCDDFTALIDERGYSTGDMLLGAVADLVAESFRSTDFMARSGSNEFALILPETPADQSAIKLKKFHQALQLLTVGRDWQVTFSIACAVYSAMPESAARVLEETRALLQKIKQTGKNRVEQMVVTAPVADSAVAATTLPAASGGD